MAAPTSSVTATAIAASVAARGAAAAGPRAAAASATSRAGSCVRLAGLAVLVALIGDCPDHQARDRDQGEQEPEQVLPTVAHGLDGSRRNGRVEREDLLWLLSALAALFLRSAEVARSRRDPRAPRRPCRPRRRSFASTPAGSLVRRPLRVLRGAWALRRGQSLDVLVGGGEVAGRLGGRGCGDQQRRREQHGERRARECGETSRRTAGRDAGTWVRQSSRQRRSEPTVMTAIFMSSHRDQFSM